MRPLPRDSKIDGSPPLLPDRRPLIWRIREYDDAGLVAAVTFAYDARGRLVEEKREEPPGPETVYELSYTYDALGNRMRKVDHKTERTTFYHYDVHEAAENFASHNNRLQWYRVYNDIFVTEPDPGVVTPCEEVMYVYDAGGHPVVIARKTDGDPVHEGLRLVYSAGGQLWLAMSYDWECDGQGEVLPGSVQCMAVREFRYETGRARYLLQDRDPVTLDVIAGSEHWSEYDSDTIYADYDIASGAADVTRMYLPGVAQMAAGAINPEYFHSDQVGTMRAMTDSSYPAEFTRRASYTAFGELVESSGGTATRYGYVGAHGYEETLLPGWDFLHVGARWYDPTTGRFLQRDPIGIQGGLNVYTHVLNNPVSDADPRGLRGGIDWGYENPDVLLKRHEKAQICAPKPKAKSPERELEEVTKTIAEEKAEVDAMLNRCAGYCTVAAGLTWECPPVAAGCAAVAGLILIIKNWPL